MRAKASGKLLGKNYDEEFEALWGKDNWEGLCTIEMTQEFA